MADEGDEDKTEKASSYKLRKAREKGSVARGMDLGIVGALAGLLGFGWLRGDMFVSVLREDMIEAIVTAPQVGDGADAMAVVLSRLTSSIIEPVGLLAGAIWLMVLLVEILQTGMVFSTGKLKPDFTRLNPATGLRRLFSSQALVLAVKSAIKFGIYATVGWLILRSLIERELPAITDATGLMSALDRTSQKFLLFTLLAAFLIAVADQAISRRQFGAQMRSSRREVRREIKDREGDPRIRQRLKQMHRELTKMARSLGQVRGADVLIVNPVHFAVALRYRPAEMGAPRVVARGTGTFALALKRVAFLYSVVVAHDPPLARSLYEKSVLDREVSPEFYAAVAKLYRRQDVKRRGATP